MQAPVPTASTKCSLSTWGALNVPTWIILQRGVDVNWNWRWWEQNSGGSLRHVMMTQPQFAPAPDRKLVATWSSDNVMHDAFDSWFNIDAGDILMDILDTKSIWHQVLFHFLCCTTFETIQLKWTSMLQMWMFLWLTSCKKPPFPPAPCGQT